MDSEKLIEMEKRTIMQSYGRIPIVIDKGKGCWVWSDNGEKFLDLVGSLATCSIGYSNKEQVNAICKQAKKIINATNLYFSEPQILLAEKLQKLSGLGKSFFSNSGSEAVEAAIKLARKVSGKTGIIATENAFHGRTMAALSATWNKKYKTYCEPLVPGFKHIPFNDAEALEQAIDEETAAFIVEPIQGESGVIVPDNGYFGAVEKICTEKGILLIVDEVQTGCGRTGTFFAFQGEGIKPDIITVAKGLGNGISIGATIAKKGVEFEKGDQGSTFGGNFLSCASALATIDFIEKNSLEANAKKQGDYFFKKLNELRDKHLPIEEIRGKGLMIGIEINGDAKKVVEKCIGMGVLVNAVNDSTIRLLPPLIISEKEIDFGIKAIEEALKTVE